MSCKRCVHAIHGLYGRNKINISMQVKVKKINILSTKHYRLPNLTVKQSKYIIICSSYQLSILILREKSQFANFIPFKKLGVVDTSLQPLDVVLSGLLVMQNRAVAIFCTPVQPYILLCKWLDRVITVQVLRAVPTHGVYEWCLKERV